MAAAAVEVQYETAIRRVSTPLQRLHLAYALRLGPHPTAQTEVRILWRPGTAGHGSNVRGEGPPGRRSGRRADLVQEGERARLTLEHVTYEVAEGGLDLPFDSVREPQAG